MAPKKKKNVTNGFSMYMMEMQKEIFEQEGRRVPIAQLVDVANPRWKELSPQQRTHYNEEAKRSKRQQKAAPFQGQGQKRGGGSDNRMDCTRNLVINRTNVADELRKKRENERILLTQNWPDNQAVTEKKFYFIAFQTLCKLPEKMGYLPCELACIEYTLKDGITRTLHRFLKPGPIPMGYRYMCQSNSANTHQIPVEGHEEAECDYHKVWQDLIIFVNPDNQRITPPVFCESGLREMVEWSLSWLSERSGISNSLRKVFEVEMLMTELYAHLEQVAHSWSTFSTMLRDSKWDHMNDTRCEYHEDLDVAIHKCALGIAKKYCFHMSDPIAAEIYDITLTDKHLPERMDMDGLAAVVYPSVAPEVTQRAEEVHQPPTARIYRSQQRQAQQRENDISSQPIRRPTTEFAGQTKQNKEYYASTEPAAPSPSAVPMPNFQWQNHNGTDPYSTMSATDQLTRHLQSTTIQGGLGQFCPGLGRGLGRGMPNRNDQPAPAVGIGRGIGRGFGTGMPA